MTNPSPNPLEYAPKPQKRRLRPLRLTLLLILLTAGFLAWHYRTPIIERTKYW